MANIRPQPLRTSSPWTLSYRVRLLLFSITWTIVCRWTPKPFNPIRLFVLRFYGARIGLRAFVHQRARISHPWNLTMGDGACLGDGAHAYCLAPITLGTDTTVAQEAYLCTASHDFTTPSYSLVTASIVLGQDSFVGARAFLLPGVTIGRGAIVGACSVVTRSVEDSTTVAGNPARVIRSLV